MLNFGPEDLPTLLTSDDIIAAVKRAFRECAAGRVEALPRAVIPMGWSGVFLAMTSALHALPGLDVLRTKLVRVVDRYRARGLPTIQASYLLTAQRPANPPHSSRRVPGPRSS